MELYANLGRLEGNPSNVVAYELGDGCIDVVFGRNKDGNHLKYSYSSGRVGVDNMATMHELAQAGQGLNAFINTTPEVRTRYDSKEIYDLDL